MAGEGGWELGVKTTRGGLNYMYTLYQYNVIGFDRLMVLLAIISTMYKHGTTPKATK